MRVERQALGATLERAMDGEGRLHDVGVCATPIGATSLT